MRSGARLLLLAGKRFTGTLTSPNVRVPDQNGRGPDCSPLSSLLSFFLLVRLGSAFLLSQRLQTFLKYAVKRSSLAPGFYSAQSGRFTPGFALDEFHHALAILILVILRPELIFQKSH